MLWYMEKVETSLNEKISSLSNPKEEVFRCILTLHSLLENPPGDIPESLREGIVEGFVGIFSAVRYATIFFHNYLLISFSILSIDFML